MNERLSTSLRPAHVLLLSAGLVVGFIAGWAGHVLRHLGDANYRLSDLVAVSWGDGEYGQAFYAAVVFTSRRDDGKLDVFARVHVAGENYFDDLGRVGVAANRAQALREWGVIRWSAGGVHFGAGAGRARFLEREKIEKHR